MAAAVKNPMEFGFVPAGTVQSLRDLGNWKVRADAIERLHQLVLDLPSGVAVLPSLDEFTGFLVRLLADPNFKISLTTLQIWDALLVKVGADARTVIPSVVPTLVRKLGDSKSVVREANMTSLGGLFRALPGETIDAIFSTFKSSDLGKGVSAARVKEDALCAVIRAILDKDAFPCQAVHPAELISNLIAAAQAGGEGRDRDAITDLRRVRATAVEALAVAHDRYGKNETWRLIDAAEDFAGGEPCVANLRWELTARFEDPRLPTLSDEGLIEHCPAAGDVLTKLRPEDALRRELETLPASRSTSRTASRGTTTEARKGLGVEGKSPSGFHASMLRMLGRSPRSVAPRSEDSRGASTPSPDGDWGEFGEGDRGSGSERSSEQGSTSESERRQPRVARNILGRRAAAANEKMLARSNSAADGLTRAPASRRDDAPAGSGEWSDGESEPGTGATPREATSPTISGRRVVGAARAGMEAMRVSDGGGGDGSGDSPTKSETGAKLSALKRRQELSRDSSRKSRETSREGSLARANSLPTGTMTRRSTAEPPAKAKEDARDGVGSGTFAPGGGVRTPSGFGVRPRPGKTGDSMASTSARSSAEGMASRAGASGSRGSASGSLRNSLADKNGAPLEECTTEELLPCPDPEPELRKAMSSLVTASTAKPTDMDWQAQYDGLISMRRLTVHHSRLVIPQLHQFTLALIPAVDSLRSSIAKVAMALVREMTRFLDPKAMDNELDYLVPVLAKKSGENTWLGGEADDALGDFARTLTDARVLAALIPQAKHKNPTVRLRVAWHVEYVCANAGAKTFVGSAANRDLLEKTFSALVPLLEEGAAETRAMCKRALCHLHGVVTPGDFEKLLKKLSSEAKIKSVRAVIEKGPPPLPTTSDGGRWTPRGKTPGSNSSRGASPASSVRPGELLSQHGFGVRRAKSMPVGVAVTNPDDATPSRGSATRTPEDARGGRLLLDALAPALAKLRSKDWKERGEGIDELESIAVRVPPGSFTESAVAALFDAVLPRLNDANAKVSARASLALAAVLPAVGDDAAPALPTLVPALAAGIGSTNDKVRSAATDAADALIENVTATLLVQHVAHCVSYGASRGKPALIGYLAILVEAVFPTRPQLVQKHALPAAMATLMNEKGPETRAANARLLKELARCVGREALLSHAAAKSAQTRAKLEDALKSKEH